MSRVTRDTPAGAAYRDLQNLARRTRRPAQELFQLYVLEGFLARLAASDAHSRFVLKGGVLLAAFDSRRPTRDIDLVGIDLANDTGTVLAAVRAVLTVEPAVADGVEFDPDTATARVIHELDDYSGVRVHVRARLATATLTFHVDINVGDPIWPAPQVVLVPRLRGGEPIMLAGYPIHMVHAEKIVTAIQRGTANTRWRDFADIMTLSRHHPTSADDLHHAMNDIARHRAATLHPLAATLDGFDTLAQARWSQWRRRSDSGHLPDDFTLVLQAVIAFTDPVITSRAPGLTWDPVTSAWQ